MISCFLVVLEDGKQIYPERSRMEPICVLPPRSPGPQRLFRSLSYISDCLDNQCQSVESVSKSSKNVQKLSKNINYAQKCATKTQIRVKKSQKYEFIHVVSWFIQKKQSQLIGG